VKSPPIPSSRINTPPTGNANYAWILHMVSKLSENGVSGFCKKVSTKPAPSPGHHQSLSRPNRSRRMIVYLETKTHF
jgi:hypothetical protein